MTERGKTERTLRFDRKRLAIEVLDEHGRNIAGARAVEPDKPDGPWWSTIWNDRGTPRDVRHRRRGGALEAMIEAATGLAADARAVGGRTEHVAEGRGAKTAGNTKDQSAEPASPESA